MNNSAIVASLVGAIVAIVIALVGAGVYVGKLGQTTTGLDSRVDELERSSGSLNITVNALSNRVGSLETDQTTQRKTGSASVPSPGGEITFSNSGQWGVWSDPVYCPPGQYVCGLRQKIEVRQGDGDDTAMNAVAFYCCSAD